MTGNVAGTRCTEYPSPCDISPQTPGLSRRLDSYYLICVYLCLSVVKLFFSMNSQSIHSLAVNFPGKCHLYCPAICHPWKNPAMIVFGREGPIATFVVGR